MNNNSSAAAKTEQFRRCELCQEVAAVYCPSDEARLCWQCDSKVHAANFLVSRHSRSLLCRRCCSPTAWSASGPRLPSMTFSLCDHCCRSRNCVQEVNHRVLDTDATEEIGENDEDDEEEEHEEFEDDDDDDDDDIDDGENQVVPWSPAKLSMPVASMSSSEEEPESQYYGLNSKRTLDELKFPGDSGSLSSFESEISIAAGGSSSDDYRDYRPSKRGHFD